MSYLIAILAISAFTLLPTTTQPQCPADTIKARSDRKLPVYCKLPSIDPKECSRYVWSFSFCRTNKDTERTILRTSISGLDVNISIDSDICMPGRYRFSGRGFVKQNAIHIWPTMELDHTHNTTGHFKDIEFIYHTY